MVDMQHGHQNRARERKIVKCSSQLWAATIKEVKCKNINSLNWALEVPWSPLPLRSLFSLLDSWSQCAPFFFIYEWKRKIILPSPPRSYIAAQAQPMPIIHNYCGGCHHHSKQMKLDSHLQPWMDNKKPSKKQRINNLKQYMLNLS